MSLSVKSPRVAIVADWIIGGGAERVVQELHELYPDAPIYASYATAEWRKQLDNKVVTGYLQKWPFSHLRKFVGILRIRWYRSLDFSAFDVVISCTGNGEAKHIRVPKKTKHICYCFTPTHYYWRHYATYIKNPGLGPLNGLARLGLKLLVNPLRKLDFQAAQHPDEFVAISKHIQDDIKRYYFRDSVIIAPPVTTNRFAAAGRSSNKRSGFVTMGRLATIKRVDIIVDACTKLGVPLKVIGRGPQLAELTKRAGSNIEFLTNVSDKEMPGQLANAEAFLFASFEDFGIAPVEALAAGTPVIAYKAGGALDYINKETGLFFNDQSEDSLIAAIKKFSTKQFNHAVIQSHAEKFSVEHFVKSMNSLVNTSVK